MQKCIKIATNKHNTTVFYVDYNNSDEILTYIINDEQVSKEFRIILNILKENGRNREFYCKVKGVEHVFEMRFTKYSRNDRIYCKEFHVNKKRHIVMAFLYKGKKSQDIPQQIMKKLRTQVKNYDYGFK